MKITAVALLAVLTAPLRATELTPWDSMGQVLGDFTITMKTGKNIKRTGNFSFTPSELTLTPRETIPRDQVKEIVIRAPRQHCCEPLWDGVVPLLFTIGSVVEYHSPLAVVEGILFLPVATAIAAVTGPPLLVIEGLRRLKPTKILYRVVP